MLEGLLLALAASSTPSGKLKFLASMRRMESNPPSTETLLLPCSVEVDDEEVCCSCSGRASSSAGRGEGSQRKPSCPLCICSSLDLLLPRIQLELILVEVKKSGGSSSRESQLTRPRRSEREVRAQMRRPSRLNMV